MKLCIKLNEETVLRGDWIATIITRDVWRQLKCGEPKHHDAVYGAMSTSKVTGIECPTKTDALNLCKAWNTTKLAVSLSPGHFSGDTFTIGDVVGSIGIAKEREPLNVGGDRKLESTGQPLTVCSDAGPVKDGVNVAPFLNDTRRKKLVVDISNAFPVDNENIMLDLGKFWPGVLHDGAVTTFGDSLPYLNSQTWEHAGVIEYTVPSELEEIVDSSPVVVVRETDCDSTGEYIFEHTQSFPSLQMLHSKVLVLLQELEYFVRPIGYYHGRLDYGNGDHDSSHMTLLVTSFGRPVKETVVRVEALHNALPIGGVITLDNSKITDIDGKVTFVFKVNKTIPFPRLFLKHPCSTGECVGRGIYYINSTDQTDNVYMFPIDGQVYHFCYFVAVQGKVSPSCRELFPNIVFSQVISFLSFSTVSYKRPYTWVDHVSPIFKQFHHLHYVMRAVLDMGSYEDVTQAYNIKLLKNALSRDINDAGYMPVTRNLSPSKMRMIQE